MKRLFIALSFVCLNVLGMEHSDDEMPQELLGSWIVIDTLGQTLGHKQPIITDLKALCAATDECTRKIHYQLTPYFKKAQLPFQSLPETQRHNRSPSPENNKFLHMLLTIKTESPPQRTKNQHNTNNLLYYPLYPFMGIVKLLQKPSPQQQIDPCITEHKKYDRVLKQGKALLANITQPGKETRALFEELKKQLCTLQRDIENNIKIIENIRISFNLLQQCIVDHEVTLSDLLMTHYASNFALCDFSIEHAAQKFGLKTHRLNDITQDAFEARWHTIQDLHNRKAISEVEFEALRKISYVLQNPTSRFLAQKFVEGTIEQHALTQTQAHQYGITEKHIDNITIEISSCKNFLMHLNKAFEDSFTFIDEVMEKLSE